MLHSKHKAFAHLISIDRCTSQLV